eukprot:15469397-Alexandrium_andersonii.AAC.1
MEGNGMLHKHARHGRENTHDKCGGAHDLTPTCTHLPGGPGMAALVPELYTLSLASLARLLELIQGEAPTNSVSR